MEQLPSPTLEPRISSPSSLSTPLRLSEFAKNKPSGKNYFFLLESLRDIEGIRLNESLSVYYRELVKSLQQLMDRSKQTSLLIADCHDAAISERECYVLCQLCIARDPCVYRLQCHSIELFHQSLLSSRELKAVIVIAWKVYCVLLSRVSPARDLVHALRIPHTTAALVAMIHSVETMQSQSTSPTSDASSHTVRILVAHLLKAMTSNLDLSRDASGFILRNLVHCEERADFRLDQGLREEMRVWKQRALQSIYSKLTRREIIHSLCLALGHVNVSQHHVDFERGPSADPSVLRQTSRFSKVYDHYLKCVEPLHATTTKDGSTFAVCGMLSEQHILECLVGLLQIGECHTHDSAEKYIPWTHSVVSYSQTVNYIFLALKKHNTCSSVTSSLARASEFLFRECVNTFQRASESAWSVCLYHTWCVVHMNTCFMASPRNSFQFLALLISNLLRSSTESRPNLTRSSHIWYAFLTPSLGPVYTLFLHRFENSLKERGNTSFSAQLQNILLELCVRLSCSLPKMIWQKLFDDRNTKEAHIIFLLSMIRVDLTSWYEGLLTTAVEQYWRHEAPNKAVPLCILPRMFSSAQKRNLRAHSSLVLTDFFDEILPLIRSILDRVFQMDYLLLHTAVLLFLPVSHTFMVLNKNFNKPNTPLFEHFSADLSFDHITSSPENIRNDMEMYNHQLQVMFFIFQLASSLAGVLSRGKGLASGSPLLEYCTHKVTTNTLLNISRTALHHLLLPSNLRTLIDAYMSATYSNIFQSPPRALSDSLLTLMCIIKFHLEFTPLDHSILMKSPYIRRLLIILYSKRTSSIFSKQTTGKYISQSLGLNGLITSFFELIENDMLQVNLKERVPTYNIGVEKYIEEAVRLVENAAFLHEDTSNDHTKNHLLRSLLDVLRITVDRLYLKFSS